MTDIFDEQTVNKGILEGYVMQGLIKAHGSQTVAEGEAFDWVEENFSKQVRIRSDQKAILPTEFLEYILGSEEEYLNFKRNLVTANQQRSNSGTFFSVN